MLMSEYSYPVKELESMDLWETVDRIKEKILWETENTNQDIQAMMISFEVNQIIDELLELSLSFTRKIITSK